MWIQTLRTLNFRNLHDHSVAFSPGLNFLVGNNGQGKTNCLEALYFCLTTKSFRVNRPTEMLRDPKSSALVRCDLLRELSHNHFEVSLNEGKSERFLNGKACKPMDFFETASVIAFSSRSKLLVEGLADERRKFLDRMVCHLDPEFMFLLARFKKIQAQLRQVLVSSQDYQVYKSFKKAIIPLAKQIVDKRILFLESIKPILLRLSNEIFGITTPLTVEYKIKNCNDLNYYQERMLDASARESQMGRSLIGPHLDDIEIRLDSHLSRSFASSGQVRALVLSMKLAVRELYQRQKGFFPVLLLDDIDSELDRERLLSLLNLLEGRGQTLLSCSKYDTILDSCPGNSLYVESGFIRSERNSE